MSRRPPFLLLGIVLGLIAFILLIERNWNGSAEAKKHQFDLYTVGTPNPTTCTVTTPHASVQMIQTNGEWKILQPYQYPAEKALVNPALNNTLKLVATATFTIDNPATQLDEYGLKEPRLIVQATWGPKAQEQLQLRIGSDTVMGPCVYAQTRQNDTTIYVVNKDIFDQYNIDPDNWRDSSLLEIQADRIQELTLTHTGKELHFQRDGVNWNITRPYLARASRQILNQTLAELAAAYIVKWLPATEIPDTLHNGLAEPTIKIKLQTDKNSDPQTIQLGKYTPANGGMIYARSTTTKNIVGAGTNLFLLLPPDPTHYRDKRLARFNWFDITQLHWTSGNTTLKAHNTNNQWHLTATPQSQTTLGNTETIEKFLQQLATLEITNFIADAATDLQRYGLDRPTTRIELAQTNLTTTNTTTLTLLIGKTQGPITYVKLDEEPFIVAIDNTASSLLQNIKPWHWLSLAVIDSPRTNITSIVTDINGHIRHYYRNGTRFISPEGQVDPIQSEILAGHLASIHAERWIGPKPYLLTAQPAWTIDTTDNNRKCQLRIWPGPGNTPSIAQYQGINDYYFELSAAETALLNIAVLDQDLAKIPKIQTAQPTNNPLPYPPSDPDNP